MLLCRFWVHSSINLKALKLFIVHEYAELTTLKTEVIYLSTGGVEQKNLSLILLSQIKEWSFFLLVKKFAAVK